MDIRRRIFFKKKANYGGGDIEIDTTYAIYYTSSDGNIVIPYKINVFGANIVSNNYINGQGIISLDGPVTSIGDYAFYRCYKLSSVTIGDSVTTIGEYAFSSCNSLTSVYISDIAAWCNISFDNSSSNPLSNGCNLYLNNELVTDLTIPDSVTTIGDNAFRNCDSLTSITIPDSVTTIGYAAFNECSSLTSVTIPDSVTTIRNDVFQDCSSLTSVYCKAITPPVGSIDMFRNNASGRKIYVPMESVEAYKSAGWWSDYADAIEGYNF